MNDIFGIPVMLIKPGDRLHPGGDKTYAISIPAMKQALQSVWEPRVVDKPWKVQFGFPPSLFGRIVVDAGS